jgi:hypothetical protein
MENENGIQPGATCQGFRGYPYYNFQMGEGRETDPFIPAFGFGSTRTEGRRIKAQNENEKEKGGVKGERQHTEERKNLLCGHAVKRQEEMDQGWTNQEGCGKGIG